MVTEPRLVGAVGVHHGDVICPIKIIISPDESDLRAVGRPLRRIIESRVIGESLHVTAVGVHHGDATDGTIMTALEHDARAVRRPIEESLEKPGLLVRVWLVPSAFIT